MRRSRVLAALVTVLLVGGKPAWAAALPSSEPGTIPQWQAVLVAAGVAALIVFLLDRIRR